MLSKNHLMLRSAQRACPRLELGARLEARTASFQLICWCVNQFPDSLAGRGPFRRGTNIPGSVSIAIACTLWIGGTMGPGLRREDEGTFVDRNRYAIPSQALTRDHAILHGPISHSYGRQRDEYHLPPAAIELRPIQKRFRARVKVSGCGRPASRARASWYGPT